MGFFRKTSWSVLFLPGVLILNGGLFLTEGFYKKEKKDLKTYLQKTSSIFKIIRGIYYFI